MSFARKTYSIGKKIEGLKHNASNKDSIGCLWMQVDWKSTIGIFSKLLNIYENN